MSLLKPISKSLSATLDFARWFSAALVVLYHLRNNLLDGQAASLDYGGVIADVIVLLTSCGPQAVTWFFVLSGFLVGGGALADLKRGRFAVRGYIIKRISRIYVVLLPALFVGYGIDWARIALFAGLHDEAERSAAYSLGTFVGNMLCLQTIAVPTLGSNAALWSLSYEAWYYVVFGLIVAATGTSLRLSVKVCLAILACATVASLLVLNRSIITLSVCWVVGASVRLFSKPILRSMSLAWACAAFAIVAYPLCAGYLRSGVNVVIALTFANVLLTASFSEDGPGPKLAAAHAYLAGFSFSLYLTHLPLLHLLCSSLRRSSNPSLNLPLSWQAFGIGCALFLAVQVFAWSFSRVTEERTAWFRRVLEEQSLIQSSVRGARAVCD